MSRRINVIGSSGNGKTTVARVLAERLDLPYVELDALNHGANWTQATNDELREAVTAAIDGDAWVVDGNYRGKIGDLVLRNADTVVWLDQPLPVVLGRLWRRTYRRIRGREALWNDNRESWRGAFWGRESLFAYAIRKHFSDRRKLPELLGRYPDARVVRLRTPRAVQEFLKEI